MVAQGISEHSAKKLIAQQIQLWENRSNSPQILTDLPACQIDFDPASQRAELRHCEANLRQHSATTLVLKPDQLLKRRGKLGLVHFVQRSHDEHTDKSFVDLVEKARNLAEKESQKELTIGKTKGFITNWILEPFVEHKEEYYVSIYSERLTDVILFHHEGGVEIGDVDSKARKLIVNLKSSQPDLEKSQIESLVKNIPSSQTDLIIQFIIALYSAYVKMHLAYLEINPFTVTADNLIAILDCAAKADNCAGYLCQESWKTSHGVSLQFIQGFGRQLDKAESYIADLDSRTGASLKFTLINPKGRIWTLIAGGGASVVYSDTICDLGYAHELANYGEYSGAPKTLEVYQYTRAIFQLMFSGPVHPDGKILLIGGSIANFTNIAETFKGIITAIRDFESEIRRHQVKFYIRRGGPNYKNGLQLMQNLASELDLEMQVYGPECNMTSIILMALGLETSVFSTSLPTISSSSDLAEQQLRHSVDSEAIPPKIADSSAQTNGHCNGTNGHNIKKRKNYAFIVGFAANAIQTMLDFDYECDQEKSVVGIVDPFQSEHEAMFFWGSEVIQIPVYKNICSLMQNHGHVNMCINFASMRSCYNFSAEIMDSYSDKIEQIVIIAEGVPDDLTRNLAIRSKESGVRIIGPSTVGGIIPGHLKIGNTGGGVDQFTSLKLYRPGSIGIVTKSGGLSSELMNIVSRCTDGCYKCYALGGDRYPCTTFIDIVTEYQNDPECKIIVLIGEIGGGDEYLVAEAIESGKVTKPVIAWCIGTCSNMFSSDIQFGHAGAHASSVFETAIAKNSALKAAGAYVPSSFEQIPTVLSQIYATQVSSGKLIPKKDFQPRQVPIDYRIAKGLGLVRNAPNFLTSIVDERGAEVVYNATPLSSILKSEQSIGLTIGNLWFKCTLPAWACAFLELCIPILADHGPAVSGAHNTIVASRAGKDLVSSLASGLLTIGPRFGGAMDDAAKSFYYAQKNSESCQQFVDRMKREGRRVMGIGHRVKSMHNPDSRVSTVVKFVNENFPKHNVLDFALGVSKILLEKKPNLILNVDGAIGAAVVDMMLHCRALSCSEIERLIEHGCVNGLFVLSRSIGFIGHYLDQKMLNQSLYRHPWDDIHKV